ncbi:MAG: hypothetical protein ACREBT_06965, partial [Thermoplasmata archaeon]
ATLGAGSAAASSTSPGLAATATGTLSGPSVGGAMSIGAGISGPASESLAAGLSGNAGAALGPSGNSVLGSISASTPTAGAAGSAGVSAAAASTASVTAAGATGAGLHSLLSGLLPASFAAKAMLAAGATVAGIALVGAAGLGPAAGLQASVSGLAGFVHLSSLLPSSQTQVQVGGAVTITLP